MLLLFVTGPEYDSTSPSSYYIPMCIPISLFPYLLQIRCGTQWDVVSRGCTGCIKINFADGMALFLADHYGVIFDLLKKMEFRHGIKTFEVEFVITKI